MGLLDDAIREHLDLKRRRGGDPAEIARAEQDALGPVRREREPAPEAGGEAPEAHDDHDEAHEQPAAEAVAEERHEPEPEPEAPDPRHSDIVHQPTTEFRVEDHHDAEEPHEEPPAVRRDDEPPSSEAPRDEDVLEETPDFL